MPTLNCPLLMEYGFHNCSGFRNRCAGHARQAKTDWAMPALGFRFEFKPCDTRATSRYFATKVAFATVQEEAEVKGFCHGSHDRWLLLASEALHARRLRTGPG